MGEEIAPYAAPFTPSSRDHAAAFYVSVGFWICSFEREGRSGETAHSHPQHKIFPGPGIPLLFLCIIVAFRILGHESRPHCARCYTNTDKKNPKVYKTRVFSK